MSRISVRGVVGQTTVEQHRIVMLYQDRDAMIQESGLVSSLASPELTVILLQM